MIDTLLSIPGLGPIARDAGMVVLERSSDGLFEVGACSVESIVATGDGKVEFIAFPERTVALVNSQMGYPAYYPVHAVEMEKPLRAVLMDLDGTTVRSEHFWIWIIERTTASLLDDPDFALEDEDFPYVSGHSVSEHLKYCVDKYAPQRTVEEARRFYFEHTHREMQAIVDGHGKQDAFVPAPGIKDFLLTLKDMEVKIGLVTSGLYEKAWPEILSAFRTMGLGDPREFYDAFITAGFPLRKGEVGTLGELEPKPHPWLYAEVGRVGLGIPFAARNRVVGIEDSGAGVCAIRLAGYPTIGIGGGNIVESGTRALCDHYCDTFAEILDIVR